MLGPDVWPIDSKGTKHEEDIERKDHEILKTDLDFADWYHGLEHGLLEASHDDYT